VLTGVTDGVNDAFSSIVTDHAAGVIASAAEANKAIEIFFMLPPQIRRPWRLLSKYFAKAAPNATILRELYFGFE